LRKITLLGVFFYLLLACNVVACYGQNTFTGVFTADSRPREMVYLSLTQTEDTVSGSLIMVTPDGYGSTKSDTLPVRGTTDGDAITLTADKLFGDLVINGRKQSGTVVLMFPTDSGSISNVVFMPTTENDYNLLLKQWQGELAAIHKEKEAIMNLASGLSEGINAVKSTGIKQNIDDIKSALDDEQSALDDLNNDLAELKDDASLRPMTCFQANSKVSHDFNSRMAHSYNSRLGYGHDKFMTNLEELNKRLSNVEPIVTKITQQSRALYQAIEKSNYPLPKLNVMPGDEKPLLEQYQALAASARNELSLLKDAHSKILNKAKGLMREGEEILKTTQESIRCD